MGVNRIGKDYSPTPTPLFPRCRSLGTCNKGGDPGREGFFPEGNEVVIKFRVGGSDYD